MTVLSDLKTMQLRACAVNPYDDEVLKLTIKRLDQLEQKVVELTNKLAKIKEAVQW